MIIAAVDTVSPVYRISIERSSQKKPRFTCGKMPNSMMSSHSATGMNGDREKKTKLKTMN